MKKIIELIDKITDYSGFCAALLGIILMLVISWGVIARYFLNSPTAWVMEISQYVFCAITLLATPYCLRNDGHVRVDIIRIKLSKKKQRIVDIMTFPFIFLLCGILIWFGSEEAWLAYVNNKRSSSALALPLWPVWSVIVLGSIIFLLQTASKYYHFFQEIKNDELSL
jgi:TRAP-type mannitol/chloroaromatic compound transport system permease small subunit